jgi:hypothetical protein
LFEINHSKNGVSMDHYIEEMKSEFPFMRPFKIYGSEFVNEGFDCLRDRNLSFAEKFFKLNILAYPNDYSGYEGLSYVYFLTDKRKKSLVFMELTLKLAKEFIKKYSLEDELVKKIEDNLDLLNKEGA